MPNISTVAGWPTPDKAGPSPRPIDYTVQRGFDVLARASEPSVSRLNFRPSLGNALHAIKLTANHLPQAALTVLPGWTWPVARCDGGQIRRHRTPAERMTWTRPSSDPCSSR